MNLFNESFHCRYSKGKCHPNPYGITSNSNTQGQHRVSINHVLLYFRKKNSPTVLVTLKTQMYMLFLYHEKYPWSKRWSYLAFNKELTELLMLSVIFKTNICVSGSILSSAKLFFMSNSG